MSENTTNARNKATLADAEVTHAIAKRIRDDSKRADKQQYFFFLASIATFAATCWFTVQGSTIPALFSFILLLTSGTVAYRSTRSHDKFMLNTSEERATETR